MTEKNETETDKLDRALRWADALPSETATFQPIPSCENSKLLAAEVRRLQSVVADQALTIGTLKDELAGLQQQLRSARDKATEAEQERNVFMTKLAETKHLLEEARAEIDRYFGIAEERDHLQHLLEEERALTAACAEQRKTL